VAGPLTTISIPFEIAVGVGVGAAVGDVVVPKLEDFKNTQWARYPHKALPAGQAALAAVKGFATALDLAQEAKKQGFDGDVFGVLEQNLREHPELALALMMWRRGYIGAGDVDRYLHRHGFDTDTRAAILNPAGEPGGLKHERLAPAQIALGIVRSIIDDPGLMPVQLDTTGGAVPAYQVSSIQALDEAADAGIDRERLRVMVGEIGLPMSPQQAASAYFRQLVLDNGRTFSREDFNRAILEGDIRPEWGDAILHQARAILSPNQYTELQLRGFVDADERRRLVAKHGMTAADSDRLLDVLGRSIAVHQITTGLERGGRYPGTYANVPQPYKAAIQRSNIREEYSELAYANRYTYPSFFAIRGLLQGGVLNADEGYQILLEMGWKPDLARKVADFYGKPPAAPAVLDAALLKSARTQALTEIRNAYLIGQADQAQAQGWLDRLAIDRNDQPLLLNIWDVMREVPQKGLSPSQIKKAYSNLPALWPRARAIDELELLGYTADDAATILDE
jgi:hypothetical protein